MMRLQRNEKGFTLVEIMIVVAIIGLLAALAIPNFIKARNRSRDSICVNNMKVIASAIEQVAMEENLNILVAGVIGWNAAAAPGTFGCTGATAYLKIAPVCPVTGLSTTYVATAGPNGEVLMTDTEGTGAHNLLAMYNDTVNNAFVLQ